MEPNIVSSWSTEFHTIALIVISIFTALTSVIVILLKLGISKTMTELTEVWTAIKEIRDKQESLRAKLPEPCGPPRRTPWAVRTGLDESEPQKVPACRAHAQSCGRVRYPDGSK